MQKKMGRPTNDPKIHKTLFRLSESEIQMLDFCVSKTGKNRAEIVREGIAIVYERLKKK